jgi:glycosyltransferase involved in cell wall biosynthesis
MKLSIIIPSFNAAGTIGEQLEALANQSWSDPWEVIVADNGSTDETPAIVERYKKRLPQLRFVDASCKKGAGHARNIGAQAATGEALLFCDADDVVGDGWLAAMGQALARYDFVASRFEPNRLNDPQTLRGITCSQQDGLQSYSYPPYLPHSGGCGLGVKRAIHEAVGGFDESLLRLQDTDYCWRIQLAGTELHFIPQAVMHIRYRPKANDAYRQARLWGEYNVLLYKRYRPLGMPKLSWKKSLRAWLRLLQRLPQLWHPEQREKWLWQFAWRLGRVQGSIKYRVFGL